VKRVGNSCKFYVKTDEHNCILAIAPVTAISLEAVEDYFLDWVEVSPGRLCGWVGQLDVCGIPLFKVENGEIVARSDAMIRADFEGGKNDE